jgi:hypothetical protein
LVNRIKGGTKSDRGLIWSLWNAWRIMPSSIRIGHYQARVNEGQKTMFSEGIINRDFATNSRELTFAKTQQKCRHDKANLFNHIWLWVVYR